MRLSQPKYSPPSHNPWNSMSSNLLSCVRKTFSLSLLLKRQHSQDREALRVVTTTYLSRNNQRRFLFLGEQEVEREGNTKNRRKEDTRVCLRLVTASLKSLYLKCYQAQLEAKLKYKNCSLCSLLFRFVPPAALFLRWVTGLEMLRCRK